MPLAPAADQTCLAPPLLYATMQGQSELGRGTVLCVNYQLPAVGMPLAL